MGNNKEEESLLITCKKSKIRPRNVLESRANYHYPVNNKEANKKNVSKILSKICEKYFLKKKMNSFSCRECPASTFLSYAKVLFYWGDILLIKK